MNNLNADNRFSIVSALIGNAFNERFEELEKLESQLLLEAYEFEVDEKVRRKLKEIDKEFLNLRRAFDIYTPNGWRVPMQHMDKIPFYWNCYEIRVTDPDLAVRIEKFAEDRESLKKERKAAKESLELRLRAYRSSKKLIEDWPEAEDVIRAVVGSKPQAQALVSFDDLNTRLNLKAA